jgi:hypothetical protein
MAAYNVPQQEEPPRWGIASILSLHYFAVHVSNGGTPLNKEDASSQ